MRYILAVIVCLTIWIHYAYGQSDSEIGVRLVPNKIMENTDGILQVYSNSDDIVKIDKLIATSSDSSIIQILGTETEKGGFVTDVAIKAVGAGDATIAIAAPGFHSMEYKVTVYKNTVTAANLLIKTTPTTFSSNGPKLGYVTVELANGDGFPTYANADIPITITSSDSGVASITTNQITIVKGSYFAVGQFETKQEGTAQISAASPSMQSVSTPVTVQTQDSPQTIQAYVYPQTLSASSAANGYLVVQLHDSSGNPAKAKEDVPIQVQITNSSGVESINTSGQNTVIQANGPLIVKKDSYWAAIPISVNAGLSGTYSVSTSAKGFMVSAPTQITVSATNALFDDKSARVDILPILATGQREIIGVLHLQDSSGNPVLAKENMLVHIDSSDQKALSVDNVKLDHGSQAALVFATVGTVAKSVTLNVVTDSPQPISLTISSAAASTFSLVAEPLVPKVLTHTDFPLAEYMTKSGALNVFASDVTPLISPKELIQTEQVTIPKYQSIALVKSSLLKEGTGTISITTQDYSTSIPIDGFSAKPQALEMDYPQKILANMEDTFSIELLDSQQLPFTTLGDMEVKIVSSDPSVMVTPDTVTVKGGTYYSTFVVQPKSAGTTELSVLDNELPLAKYTVSVVSLSPAIGIVSNDYTNPNASLEATATVHYHDKPLSGVSVEWNVNGAQIQSKETITDENGNAKISLIAQDPTKITIQVTAQGGIYGIASASKDVNVNQPLVSSSGGASAAQSGSGSQLSVLGINPLFIIIPVAAGAGGFFFLKKKNMLEGISEKISFAERFSEIKERIPGLKER
ncbi:MAG: hypothetical protein AUG16_00995 [Thaumarchaeota archaeon 13_1_20CM_2_39_20]|nr:MAG: hypothetical protein AUG16_00995 [Thaumarchaeota archaeon 13_1_20CM_2_39_20]